MKREIKPIPDESPTTCRHKWEPHLWEQGVLYCPYCASLKKDLTNRAT